jgi:hypothetical protein
MGKRSEANIEIIRHKANLATLRHAWESMSLEPNADIDFYTTIIDCRTRSAERIHGEVLCPHVIVLREHDKIISILAGRIESKRLDISLGYKRLSLPAVRCLTLINGGLMGDDSEQTSAVLVRAIRSSLENGEADVAWFHGVSVDSTFYQAARKAGGLFTRDHFPSQIMRWKLDLPVSFDQLYRSLSSNTRHNLKRYSKRLGDAFGKEVKIWSYRGPIDLDQLFLDTEAVAEKTYHRGMRVGFIANEEMQSWMTLAASRGWLRAYILYIKNKPCAFWNGLVYGRTLFTSTTGYDASLADYRPGTFLLQHMIQDICGEGSADHVDFGFGDAQYKRDWCKRANLQSSFFLFAPRPKGIFVNCLRAPLMGPGRIARSALTSVGALQKVKQMWRQRLAPSSPRQ